MIFFCMIFVSCTKQKSIEDIFYTSSNDYWQYYAAEYYGPVYLKFNKNKTVDEVGIEKGKFKNMNSTSDIKGSSGKWFVSKDSILTWDVNTFDIVSYNDKIIVLYIEGQNESDKKITSEYIYLVKATIDHEHNGPGYYENKRKSHPEKYKEQ